MRTTKVFLLLLALLSLTGCASVPGVDQRTAQAERLAMAHGWQAITLDTALLPFRAFGPEAGGVHGLLTVYIEGDGLAWVTRSRPSGDPTPVHPIGLRLALTDPSPGAVYLARPCQYVVSDVCRADYWLDARFSAEVIEAMSEALDELKSRYRSDTLLLVGYSGGGAVAALLASERSDIDALVTVAGNLDHEFWTSFHQISPLSRSLNPADRAKDLAPIPQWHFIGGSDVVVPPEVANAYVKQLPSTVMVNRITKLRYGHQCCWEESWPTLIRPIRRALGMP